MKRFIIISILTSLSFIISTQILPAQSQADREKAQAFYKQGLEQIEASKFAEAYESFRNACQLDTANWDYKVRHMVLSSYMGQQALFAGKHAKALELFTAAFNIKRELTKEEDVEYITLKRFIELTEEHKKCYPVKPEYTYRIQVLYLMNTDIKKTFDKKNQPIICKGSIPKKFPDQMVRYHEMLRIYIETLSRGRMSISYDTKMVDATITSVVEENCAPDFNSIQPSLSPLLFTGRNTYDTILYYWYSGKLPATIHASWDGGVILAPYAWRSNAVRGRIVLHTGEAGLQIDHISNLPHHWIAFHEFFHHIETLCGNIAPQHAQLPSEFPKARANFPNWVPDMNKSWTATEYSWYKYHIQNTVPARMEELARETGLAPAWRNMSYVNRFPDTTDENLIKTYTKLQEKISLSDRQKAADLVDQGFKLMWSGKHKESQASFEQAYKHNPYHHRALIQLGWGAIYFYKNDFALADRYYTEMTRVFPEPQECFSAGMLFFERNQFALAVPYFRIAAEKTNHRPGYAAWFSRALAASGDARGAAAEAKRISDHPVMKTPMAVIESRDLDVCLLTSGSCPDGEDTVALYKLWQPTPDRARWHLVPAEDGEHVRIVSNLHWRCLDVREDKIVITPMGKSPSQEWKLVKLVDGQYRFVSRPSGRSLAIVPALGQNRPVLALQFSSNSRYQKWSVEISDPLAGLAETIPPAWIISTTSGLAVAIKGADQSNGAPVIQWTRENGPHFQWRIIPIGSDGSHILLSVSSGKCLTAHESDGGFSIQNSALTRKPEQLWRMVKRKDGGIKFINQASGLALQPNTQETNGLTLGVVEDSAPQWWKLEY